MLTSPSKQSYYERNKQRVAEYSKQWHERNKDTPDFKERAKARAKAWHLKNREHRKQLDRERYLRNKDKKIKQSAERHKERCKTDELYRIKTRLRESVRHAFQRIKLQKPARTEKLLGCNWQQAKEHFERLFQEGMSWDNHGEWHIDHIRPVSSFTLEDVHLMNHISNLQPLWSEDNARKGACLEI